MGPAGPPGESGGATVIATATGTGSFIATASVTTYTQLPGLSATITIPAGRTYNALIETDGGVQVNGFNPNAACVVDVAVFVDGAQLGPGRRVAVMNNDDILFSVTTYALSVQTTLTPGTHTVAVMAKPFPTVIAECYVSSAASGSGLPGNPRLQGVLNVIAFP
jgi:hypothetical protein